MRASVGLESPTYVAQSTFDAASPRYISRSCASRGKRAVLFSIGRSRNTIPIVAARSRYLAALTIIIWMASGVLPLFASGETCSVAASCCVGKLSCPMRGHHQGMGEDQCHGDDAKPVVNVAARHFTLIRSAIRFPPIAREMRFVPAGQAFGDFMQPAPDPPPPRLG